MTGCGGEESNLRPLGYEPNELPLLYPASFFKMPNQIANSAFL